MGKNKEIEKMVICNISSDNQIPPGSKRRKIANRKYINDEFEDASSPRRNKNVSVASPVAQRKGSTDKVDPNVAKLMSLKHPTSEIDETIAVDTSETQTSPVKCNKISTK